MAAVGGIGGAGGGAGGSSAWSLIHQLQMMILFLLIPTYISDDVRALIEDQDFVLFTFNFIPAVDIPYLNVLCEWFESDQTVQTLVNLGIESQRTFNNLFSLMLVFSGIALLHLGTKFTPE
jgi:hypothetical protein